jgi:hypothetical protein
VTVLTHALRREQIERFRADGFLASDGVVLEPHEVESLRAAYMDCLEQMQREGRWRNIRPGRRDDGSETEVYQIRAAHLCHPRFDDLIRDPRILDPVQSLLGVASLKLVLCQGLYKPPRTGGEIAWHQDDYYFEVDKPNAVVSCWVTFDDATIHNGCMWILPGWHDRLRPHEGLETAGYAMASAEEEAAVPVELKAGELMFHHGAAPHRTPANDSDGHRRALAIHYMDATARPLGGDRESEPPENMPVVRGGLGGGRG